MVYLYLKGRNDLEIGPFHEISEEEKTLFSLSSFAEPVKMRILIL
jgi:hypothetical protein